MQYAYLKYKTNFNFMNISRFIRNLKWLDNLLIYEWLIVNK